MEDFRLKTLILRALAQQIFQVADSLAHTMQQQVFLAQEKLAWDHLKAFGLALIERDEANAKWWESFHDRTQLTLDGAGMLPIVGIFADLLNSGYSIYRGNMGDAAINAFAAIPFFGDGAKAAKMAAKHADEVLSMTHSLAWSSDSIVKGLSEVDRVGILRGMEGITEHADAVVRGIENGKIKLSIVGDELFKKAWEKYWIEAQGWAPALDTLVQGFQWGTKIFVRRDAIDIASTIVHEGRHVFDDLRVLSTYARELNAYLDQFYFEFARGLNRRFEDLPDLLQWVMSEYGNLRQ